MPFPGSAHVAAGPRYPPTHAALQVGLREAFGALPERFGELRVASGTSFGAHIGPKSAFGASNSTRSGFSGLKTDVGAILELKIGTRSQK